MIPIETELWVECDCCGGAFGGPGLVMEHWGRWLVCERCWRKLTSASALSPGGVCRASGHVSINPKASEGSRVA